MEPDPARLRACATIVCVLSLCALSSQHGPAAEPALVRTPPPRSHAARALRDGERLELNAATEQELVLLPGVGPKLAARIVAERSTRGGFRELRELRAVRGIGPVTFATLERFVHVAQSSKSSAAPSMQVK